MVNEALVTSHGREPPGHLERWGFTGHSRPSKDPSHD